MKYSGIGGQAVIEGIMMKNSDRYSVAVRKPNGEIEVMEDSYEGFGKKHAWARLPIIRGAVNFVDSMVLGIRTLMYSADFFEDDEETEPSKFEKWFTDKFGDKADKVLMTMSTVLAFVVAVVVFMWLPLAVTSFLGKFIRNDTVEAVIEGILRVWGCLCC